MLGPGYLEHMETSYKIAREAIRTYEELIKTQDNRSKQCEK